MRHGDGNNDFWQEGPRHGHDIWWGGPLHLILFLLLVALLVLAVVWLVRRLQADAATRTSAAALMPAASALGGDPAVAVLRMRYAKGEVSREDFQRAVEDLTGAAPPWPGSGSAGDDVAPTAS